MTPSHPPFVPFGHMEIPDVGFSDAKVVVLPLCYEQGASYGTGSASGPYHILNASTQMEKLDEQTQRPWGTSGVFTSKPLTPDPADPATAVAQMRKAADRVLSAGKFLLSLGGDHAVSIGPILAAASRHSGLGVLQVDAHLDLRDFWNNSRFNHACVMRRVVETGKVRLVQAGIRSVCPEEIRYAQKSGLSPFFAHEISPENDAWIQRVMEALPETVYMSLDLDGLDPSVIPGTGTPEPGGLTYRQVLALIFALAKHKKVVAADVTELAKIPQTQVSEYTAAKIAAKMIHFFVEQP